MGLLDGEGDGAGYGAALARSTAFSSRGGQGGLELPCGFTGVRGSGDGADHGDPARAGTGDLGESGEVDASDGEPRPVGTEAGGGPHQVKARRWPPALRWRWPARADSEVVGSRLSRCGGCLAGIMGRAPDDNLVTEDLAGIADGKVVLAEMEDIRSGRQGDIGPVIYRQ